MTVRRCALVACALLLGASVSAVAAAPSQARSAQSGCGDTTITEPTNAASLSGSVPVFGSALINDFDFYKVEYAPGYAPDSWAAVSSVIDRPVLNGLLDMWDTTRVADGPYQLKLTVVNPAGEEICRSIVTDLYVGNQATATASPTASPEASATPTATFAVDEPTDEPTAEPTVEPIIPSETSGQSVSGNSLKGIVDAFVKGFFAALLASAAALVVYALRR